MWFLMQKDICFSLEISVNVHCVIWLWWMVMYFVCVFEYVQMFEWTQEKFALHDCSFFIIYLFIWV